ncbi:helix-turn-helix domain-containing protein [Parahaliea aestuarii]|uniref:Helix-turn-helix domain-containing protein n=1 Tax=Parahaliea aestuarii TaxID=1852021 RepID=A0A5C9A412_9GAMM|nr:helix-turn-helix domain-containing protein [Parahaliea aestuarii]TXS94734.1 helix-turn-helix domain-containing protein [Parahaliea aestuarii]
MSASPNPSLHTRGALISLANALVAALQSEDADTAFLEQTRQFVDLLGDTLTLPVTTMLNLDQLDLEARHELLAETLEELGLPLAGLNWHDYPELAMQFQSRVWAHFYHRFLLTHQIVTSHIELLPAPEPDFPRPLHTPAGSWLLLYAAAGECLLSCADSKLRLGNNGPALLLIPPECQLLVQCAQRDSECSLFSSAFFPPQHWQALLRSGVVNGELRGEVIADAHIAGYISESFGRIIDIAHSQSRHSQALHLNLLEQILLLCDQQRPQQQRESLDRRVVAARDYLLAHYAEKTTVEQVAAAANAAPSTLNALFKSQMGENLMRWRDQLRMQKARELLQGSDKAVKVIAAEVGYDDPMFFSRRFKQLTGWSPTQIRDGKS